MRCYDAVAARQYILRSEGDETIGDLLVAAGNWINENDALPIRDVVLSEHWDMGHYYYICIYFYSKQP